MEVSVSPGPCLGGGTSGPSQAIALAGQDFAQHHLLQDDAFAYLYQVPRRRASEEFGDRLVLPEKGYAEASIPERPVSVGS